MRAWPPPSQLDKSERARIEETFRSGWVAVVVLVLAVEGTTLQLSFEREHSITRERTVPATVAEIKARLAEPIALTETRSAFLSVFPLPHTVEAGSLAEGDIHRTHFTYKRWPIGNTHEGMTAVRIAEVGPRHVVTRVESNSAYFSHYLTVHGTRIDMTPRADGTTDVSLTIHYRRDLDPAWYFGPLQRRAIAESADYLIDQLMVRDD